MPGKVVTAAALAVLAAAASGCTAHSLAAPEPMPEVENDQYYEVNPVRDLDLLFLIDDSPSMADKQNNLAANMPALIDALKAIPGGLASVHIGVVTSDLGAGPTPIVGGCDRVGGDRGVLQIKPGCGVDANSRFLSSLEGGTWNNFQGDIAKVFACIATVGDRGCGYEHQLQALRVALSPELTPENAGFLRPEAYLGLVLLTDEDDCSASPDSTLFMPDPMWDHTTASLRCAREGHLCRGVAPTLGPFMAPLLDCAPNDDGRLLKVGELVDAVRAAKPRPDQQIVVAAIRGWADDEHSAVYQYGSTADGDLDYLPICHGGPAASPWSATAAIRVKKFVESFGNNGSLHSICADDFSPAMKQIGEKLAATLSTPCIESSLADTRPDPGVQPECEVIDRVPDPAGGYDDVAVPPCGGGQPTCWQLKPDPACARSGFRLEVRRAQPAPQGMQQVIKCLGCTRPDDQRCVR
jgi:hypothetical protein